MRPGAIHQHEARAVNQAAIHAVELESVEAKVVEAARLAGQEMPARGIGGEVFGVRGEDGRGVVLRDRP